VSERVLAIIPDMIVLAGRNYAQESAL
jgi:hypothetical protein